jgi:hypothetical protein
MVFRANKCRIRQKKAACGGTKPHGTNKDLGKKFFQPKNNASGRIKDHTGKKLSDPFSLGKK